MQCCCHEVKSFRMPHSIILSCSRKVIQSLVLLYYAVRQQERALVVVTRGRGAASLVSALPTEGAGAGIWTLLYFCRLAAAPEMPRLGGHMVRVK